LSGQVPLGNVLPRSCSEGIPSRHGGITPNEPASKEAAYVSGACSWSAPNNTWLLEALLEELTAIHLYDALLTFP